MRRSFGKLKKSSSSKKSSEVIHTNPITANDSNQKSIASESDSTKKLENNNSFKLKNLFRTKRSGSSVKNNANLSTSNLCKSNNNDDDCFAVELNSLVDESSINHIKVTGRSASYSNLKSDEKSRKNVKYINSDKYLIVDSNYDKDDNNSLIEEAEFKEPAFIRQRKAQMSMRKAFGIYDDIEIVNNDQILNESIMDAEVNISNYITMDDQSAVSEENSLTNKKVYNKSASLPMNVNHKLSYKVMEDESMNDDILRKKQTGQIYSDANKIHPGSRSSDNTNIVESLINLQLISNDVDIEDSTLKLDQYANQIRQKVKRLSFSKSSNLIYNRRTSGPFTAMNMNQRNNFEDVTNNNVACHKLPSNAIRHGASHSFDGYTLENITNNDNGGIHPNLNQAYHDSGYQSNSSILSNINNNSNLTDNHYHTRNTNVNHSNHHKNIPETHFDDYIVDSRTQMFSNEQRMPNQMVNKSNEYQLARNYYKNLSHPNNAATNSNNINNIVTSNEPYNTTIINRAQNVNNNSNVANNAIYGAGGRNNEMNRNNDNIRNIYSNEECRDFIESNHMVPHNFLFQELQTPTSQQNLNTDKHDHKHKHDLLSQVRILNLKNHSISYDNLSDHTNIDQTYVGSMHDIKCNNNHDNISNNGNNSKHYTKQNYFLCDESNAPQNYVQPESLKNNIFQYNYQQQQNFKETKLNLSSNKFSNLTNYEEVRRTTNQPPCHQNPNEKSVTNDDSSPRPQNNVLNFSYLVSSERTDLNSNPNVIKQFKHYQCNPIQEHIIFNNKNKNDENAHLGKNIQAKIIALQLNNKNKNDNQRDNDKLLLNQQIKKQISLKSFNNNGSHFKNSSTTTMEHRASQQFDRSPNFQANQNLYIQKNKSDLPDHTNIPTSTAYNSNSESFCYASQSCRPLSCNMSDHRTSPPQPSSITSSSLSPTSLNRTSAGFFNASIFTKQYRPIRFSANLSPDGTWDHNANDGDDEKHGEGMCVKNSNLGSSMKDLVTHSEFFSNEINLPKIIDSQARQYGVNYNVPSDNNHHYSNKHNEGLDTTESLAESSEKKLSDKNNSPFSKVNVSSNMVNTSHFTSPPPLPTCSPPQLTPELPNLRQHPVHEYKQLMHNQLQHQNSLQEEMKRLSAAENENKNLQLNKSHSATLISTKQSSSTISPCNVKNTFNEPSNIMKSDPKKIFKRKLFVEEKDCNNFTTFLAEKLREYDENLSGVLKMKYHRIIKYFENGNVTLSDDDEDDYVQANSYKLKNLNVDDSNIEFYKMQLEESLVKKLEVLCSEKAKYDNMVRRNNELGVQVFGSLSSKLDTKHIDKYTSLDNELDSVMKLLFKLCGMMTKIENNIISLPHNSTDKEKATHHTKLEGLKLRLTEATTIKQSVSKRYEQLLNSTQANLTDQQLDDLKTFFTNKCKYLIECNDINENILLSQAQLQSLRNTMNKNSVESNC